jgi:hypothetical protein
MAQVYQFLFNFLSRFAVESETLKQKVNFVKTCAKNESDNFRPNPTPELFIEKLREFKIS